MSLATATIDAAVGIVPPAPATLRETGLSAEQVIDLMLRALYVQGARTGQQLTDTICLPFSIVDEQLLHLQQRRFIEVVRTMGPARGNYVFELSGPGRERARAAMEASQWIGAAPVPLATYRAYLDAQSVRGLHIGRERIREHFSHLVLGEDLLEALGPAVNSASSLFLYGDPGNGKTVIAEAIAQMLGGDIYIPQAVDIEGQTMLLFDPVHHRLADDDDKDDDDNKEDSDEYRADWLRPAADWDRRFVRIRRPVIMVGGELSLDQLDLRYDAYTKVYQAPFQLKAGGGVLIVDDFGRQLVPPRDLLNRWIVPLEKRVDFLTLHTGVKFPVPFDCLLIFATNLNPHELVDEAFLRRIQYKISVHDPDPAAYREIFSMVCTARGVAYDPAAVDYIYHEYYQRRGIPPRACHPRDVVDHLIHAARYERIEPRLTEELLDQACKSYFLVMAHDLMTRHDGEEVS